MSSRRLLLTIIFIGTIGSQAHASHLRAGEILVRRVSCSSLTFQITVTAYLNTNSSVSFGGLDAFLFFGDGSSMNIPEITDVEIIDSGLNIGRVSYSTTYTYLSPGEYLVGFRENNRNEGIVNVASSVQQPFYIETLLVIEQDVCNSSPTLLVPPMDRACAGVAFYHNPGAFDPDNDSLSFELVVPKRDTGNELDYSYPDDPEFYTDHDAGNEAGTGAPTFTIDPIDGTISWDAPQMIGEYAIALKVIEWKRRAADSTWYRSGYVVRDMQVVVESCDNMKPELTVTADICAIAGETILLTMPATDPDGDPVFIEAFSDAFQLTGNKPVVDPPDGTLQATAPPYDTAALSFAWQTSCELVRDLPYRFIFKISDQPPAGPRLVQFYTLNIRIIAPAPVYESVTINPVSKNVLLEWQEYPCNNVTSFQVWRRTSSYLYTQPECNTGMPSFLRYKLIAEVPGSALHYTDGNLSHGAEYCYRIVALVGDLEAPGRISLDTCFIPKPAEAPVITHVSVAETDPSNGEMVVRWTSPFEIDKIQYPPPYRYKVYRQNESAEGEAFAEASPVIADTVFTDAAIDTENAAYRYKIQLFVPALSAAPVDTSSEASSVFLTAKPLPGAIRLTWAASTPWYNYAGNFPYHLIYRKEASGPFLLIDSVNVIQSDFVYVDSGQYEGTPLTDHTDYYYKVVTRGTYGHPAIPAPQENFSQIVRERTLDTIPPCPPQVSIAPVDCSTFACGDNVYYNQLQWLSPDPVCDRDVVSYDVLVSEDGGASFSLLATTAEIGFRHEGLSTLDKCYRIISTDYSGNRSDSSAMVCGTNCLSFKLPNVITPGMTDGRNDFLTGYPAAAGRNDCARSVERVSLSIYNRWGKEIFTTSVNAAEEAVFWHGISNSGSEVASGTYYYTADVLFDTTDASKQKQLIKGWIHVVR